MDALIVVDVQNDFLPGGALAVPQGNEVIAPINRLTRQFEITVATQDWHPVEHLSFAANHANRRPFETTELEGLTQTLWPVHCVQGTLGAEFAKEIVSSRFRHVVRKGIDPHVDSYSGFFDNGRRHATELDQYLKRHGIDRIFVCGLAFDYCVKWTAVDGAMLGYRSYVIENACRAIANDQSNTKRLKDELHEAGVELVRSDALPLS